MTSPDAHGKGLSGGSLGFLGNVTLGVSSVAPAYTLTATLGLLVAAVGVKMPAIFLPDSCRCSSPRTATES